MRRADGQVIQLTPMLYAVLELIDDRRSYADIATLLGQRISKLVEPTDIGVFVQHKLRPLGLLRRADGAEPQARRANPLLAIKMRHVVTDAEATDRIVAPFTRFFHPAVIATFVLSFFVLIGWLFFVRGLGMATRDLLFEPALVLVVFALTIASSAFHEMGHAAACRYGGGRPGAIGFGLYLIWPAFYTDVTDSYRLNRRARLRVDLGGIYFNTVFAVAAFGLWAFTRWEALLIVIPLQVVAITRQLIPFIRLDGYHILADLTGVPDLFAHMKPILLSLIPWRKRDPRLSSLRPRVRVIVTAWVLMVAPLLALMLTGMVIAFPRVAATAWQSLGLQWEGFLLDSAANDLAGTLMRVLSMAAITIPVLSMAYLAWRIGRRTTRRVWTVTEGRPVMRGLAVLVAAAMLAGLATQWWPDGQYRPIEATDRGAVDVRFSEVPILGEAIELFGGRSAERPATTPHSGIDATSTTTTAAAPDAEATIVEQDRGEAPAAGEPQEAAGFRFNDIEAPAEGDNQAAAVNYEDGTSVVDMAISLIFDTDETVDQDNEAWALASCDDCSAVAVAFQVLLILDSANVVIPENFAVAVGAFCAECRTVALAFQLVATLQQPLSEDAMTELMVLWDQLETIQENIEDIPVDQLYVILIGLQQEILGVLIEDGAVVLPANDVSSDGTEGTTDGSTEGTTDGSTDGSTGAEGTTSDGTTSDGSTSDGSDTTSEPTPEPTTEPSPEPTTEPSPEPSAAEPAPTP